MTWRELTILGYLVIVGAGVALEVVSRRPDSKLPSFELLLSRVMRTRSGRVSVLAAWTWVGLHFFAR
ncbi:MAG TPA: DUF6186 family protein [Actinomycetes bacterium]|nr:DUF6186 family protein [Actinomycetes bacterium]